MRRVGLALGLLVAAGCGSVGKGGAALPDYTLLENFSRDDQLAIDSGDYVLLPKDIGYFVDPASPTVMMPMLVRKELETSGCRARVGPLRNPKGTLVAVSCPDPAKLAVIERMAKAKGVDRVRGSRLPYLTGPNGKTPILKKSSMRYAPDESARLVQMEVYMEFADAKSAKAAAAYLDKADYPHQVSGNALIATFMAPMGAATDEQEAFERWANRLNGELKSFSSSYTVEL